MVALDLCPSPKNAWRFSEDSHTKKALNDQKKKHKMRSQGLLALISAAAADGKHQGSFLVTVDPPVCG